MGNTGGWCGDHASIHRSQVLREAQPEREKTDITLWFLPSCSPERNDIEHLFGRVKHPEMPTRTYDTTPS